VCGVKIRLVWLAALLTVALASAVQAADDWKTYRYPQDGFAAEYPIPPAAQDQKAEPQRIIRGVQYWSERDDVAFGVGATLFLHKTIAGLPADRQIHNVIEGVRGSLKCSIRSQRAITFPGAAAREVIFDKCPAPLVAVVERIFIAGDRLFQVMVLGNKPGIENSPDTKRFLESFSLIAQ
jgi:hypothetical protein